MFVCKIDCIDCDYQSDPFIEGYNLHSDAFTFLCQNSETQEIRFLTLSKSEIPVELVTDDQIESFVTINPPEKIIKSHFGVEEIINIQCPNCGRDGLSKRIIGVN